MPGSLSEPSVRRAVASGNPDLGHSRISDSERQTSRRELKNRGSTERDTDIIHQLPYHAVLDPESAART